MHTAHPEFTLIGGRLPFSPQSTVGMGGRLTSHAVLIEIEPAGRTFTAWSSRQRSWSAIYVALERFSRLPDDWDGDGGCAPGYSQLQGARQLLATAQGAGVSAPEPYVEGDGEFGFVWKRPEGFASLSFLPDGRITGKVRLAGRDELRIDEPFFEAAGYDALIGRLVELG